VLRLLLLLLLLLPPWYSLPILCLFSDLTSCHVFVNLGLPAGRAHRRT
jgi:hypothetical protein